MDGAFLNGLNPDDALRALLPVAIYVLGMAIYAVFIFKFYRFIAGRDIFNIDLSRNDASSVPALRDFFSLIWYVIRFIVLFPAFAFFWVAILTVMLAFLSEGRALSQILIIALATVSAVRVCAYYDEDLSRDLAKILPFAVLSFLLVNASPVDVGASLAVLREVNSQWGTIIYYWLFLVALEFALRLVFGIFKGIFPSKKREEPARAAGNAPATTSDD